MGKYIGATGLTYLWGKIKSALSGKQDTLVSGTNIKTINNESIIGSGNLTISGSNGLFDYNSTNEAIVIYPASAASYDSTNENITIS